MQEILDLDRYPLDDLHSTAGLDLIKRCRAELAETGMFNLEGLVRPDALARAVDQVSPVLREHAFAHIRKHNIYFKKDVPGLSASHPALAEFETSNHTICADQIAGSVVVQIYEFPGLARFLAQVMGKPELFQMADPLARANVMQYSQGEALNWHFDRSEFTTTLLLQAPDAGGAFEYATDLRTDDDPRYDDVVRLIAGNWPVERLDLAPGTLNVFKGKNTAHRVTPVEGAQNRIIAVFSYYERPGVQFSAEERIGFYGRAA